MQKKLLAGAGVVAVSAAAFAVPALAATKSVKIGDSYFVRAKGVPTVTAKKGDAVKWNWTGKFPHNVTVKSGPAKFKSTTQKKGSFSRKITKAGTYTIICTVHGQKDQSMRLVVK